MRRGALPIAVGSGAAVLILIGLVVSATLFSPEPGQRQSLAALDDSPLPGGVQTTLESAERAFDVPVLRPETSIASDERVAEVWVRTSDLPEVFIVYSSGLIVTVRPDEEGLPTKQYASAQLADGVPGKLIEVSGISAFLVPASDESGGGSLRFITEGAIVTIFGGGKFSSEQLVAQAQSTLDRAGELAGGAG